jgi:D-alanine-D-alanine ligase-like ATP-grasp enzyme
MTGHSLLPKAAAAARVDFVDLCLRLVDAASQRVFYFHRMAG